MQAALVLIGIVAGIGSALQSGSNGALEKGLAAPLWTVVVVSAVTLLGAVVIALLVGERFPVATLGRPAWWAWIGGVFGLGFVLATVFAAPRLGAGMFVGLVVTASTVAGLALDHWGLMSFDVHRAGVGRIVGGLLMIAGVGLVAAF